MPLVAFVLSIAVLAFSYGFVAAWRHWQPAPIIFEAYHAAEDMWENWRNDLGFEPTRLVVPAPTAAVPQAEPPAGAAMAATANERPRMLVSDEDRSMEGYRFVSGLTAGYKDTLFGAMLLDRAGEEVHFWPIDFEALSPGGLSPFNVYPHGMLPMPDGSLIFNFDVGDVLARIDACGETLWVTEGRFHHGMSLSYDGTLWSWENEGSQEYIVQLDPDTGERLRRISLFDDIVDRHDLYGRFAIISSEAEDGVVYGWDPYHPNDVSILMPEMADAFPMFTVGDIMISLRSVNMVAVIDPETTEVKWSQIGPWHRQHDPKFLPDGTISVYDNRMGLGASRIVVVDPATGDTRDALHGDWHGNFYSWRRGRHQPLPNGNIMIAESETGRAMEVDPEGQVVWAYENVFDETNNGPVNEALVLPVDFFADGVLARCHSS